MPAETFPGIYLLLSRCRSLGRHGQQVQAADPGPGAAGDEAVSFQSHAVCDSGGHELPSLCSLVSWSVIARTCGMRVGHPERGRSGMK